MNLRKKDKKIRIIFINYSLDIGGAETLILDICRGLNPEKYEPCVCCLKLDGVLMSEFEKAGIPVYVINKKTGIDYLLFFKFLRLFIRLGIDIVNTHGAGSWLFAGIAAKLCGKKLIHTEHTKPYHNLGRWKKIEKFLTLFTDQIITVGDSVAEFMIKEEGIPRDKVRVIHNGIRTELYRKEVDRSMKRREIGVEDSHFVVGNVARMFINKDHATLLKAFKIVTDVVPGARLVLVGDGPLRSDISALAQTLGVKEKMIFLGNRRDIPELLKTFDIFALSSILEGFPIVLLEAMAAGLPVVATNVDGNSELVLNGETGYLTPPCDAKLMADNIIRMSGNANDRRSMGFKAQRMIKEKFDFSRTIAIYEGLFESV